MMRARDILFFLGRPLSPFYAALMRIREKLYLKNIFRQHRLPVPVISVGNLTMGGAGKTPFVIHIARELLTMGRKPAVVSRGYGGKARDAVNVVSDTVQVFMTSVTAGDEPLLLAESLPGVPVITGPKRAVAGYHAVKKLGADTIIMDDGFQHMGLSRDLNLVLFSAMSPLGNNRVFPGGDLREPFSALNRADAFVITSYDDHTRDQADTFRLKLKTRFPSKPVFTCRHQPSAVRHSQKSGVCCMKEAKEVPLYGFCGLANPESFRRLLIREGFQVWGFQSFKDHHIYTESDIADLTRKARETGGAALITTEKDYVKLKEFAGPDFSVLILVIELDAGKEFSLFLAGRIHKALEGINVLPSFL